MFITWFLTTLLDRSSSIPAFFNKREVFKILKLPLAGTLALLTVCSTFYSQPKASIYPASCFRHSEETLLEDPNPKCCLPIPDHPAVDTWVRRFSEQYHCSFQIQLDRAHFYSAPAHEIFTNKGLPKDLIYVALIESGFTINACSRAKAVGMWQIVSQTGTRFGLEQNKWVDQRRDPMKAAQAAADYLSLLYDKFGSWSLALAAYNAGENAVRGALQKSGLNTFWDLMENGFLPAETRDYVPKVFAAVKIIRNPDLYGFRMEEENFVARHETVSVPGGLKLSWVCKLLGIPKKLLQKYNPELCKSTTPPTCFKYDLCLPVGTRDDLRAVLAKSSPQEEKPAVKDAAEPQLPAFTLYKVKSGDTWSALARRYKCSVTALADPNGMKPSQPLKAGHVLKLPAETTLTSLSKVETKDNKGSASASSSSRRSFGNAPQKSVRYLVRRGDTLWSIADKFHVPIKTLCAQNRVNPRQNLAPGNILAICTSRQCTSQSVKKKVN